jgi:2'-deoxynucleoside 5'-phosphate N-hydrolase
MQIYFAGSIRAGRDDVALYNAFIGHLSSHGSVVTEHVGDYSLSLQGQSGLPDTHIHDRDLKWLRGSDVVVAEVTTPSLGVGYEIATAVHRSIPTIALFRGDRARLSAMIAGSSGVRTIFYEDLHTAIEMLDSTLSEALQ